MKNRFLETGKIVNTHGIAGEVKIMPWADEPEFLLDFDALYIDGKPWEIHSARVHKNCVLVKFEADAAASGSAALIECGKDVAMQIAALNAPYLDEASVPADVVAHEKEVQLALMKNDPKNANKPENILEKMITGKMRKYFEEVCLLNQAFVKDGNLNVAQYVDQQAKNAGGAMALVDFVRYEKGEGLAKREDDFASEVASMVK